jgi:hypothetical protein
MPFWSKGDSNAEPAAKDFTSSDESPYTHSDTMPTSAPSGASAALQETQQIAMAIQQQTLINTTINNLTVKAFEKCVTGKPGSDLSRSEESCVQATTLKWLDTNTFLLKRLEKKLSAQAQQPGNYS